MDDNAFFQAKNLDKRETVFVVCAILESLETRLNGERDVGTGGKGGEVDYVQARM